MDIKHLIVATNEEIVALKKAGCTEKIHCCGRGAIDVPETTYDDIIINVGIGRSLGYEIGTVVNPSGCFDIGQDQYFSLYHDSSFGYTLCLTTDFEVEENFCNNYPSNTIYDHELGKLLSLPHKEIKCLKIVGYDYEQPGYRINFSFPESWSKVWRIIQKW